MKQILLLTLLMNSFQIYSQTSLPIKFKVTETAEVRIGENWDYTYNPLHTPINVIFDGKILKMVYETGKVYFEKSVISFTQKQLQKYGKADTDLTILKIDRDGYLQYIVIKYKYNWAGTDNNYNLSLPYVFNGEVFSYAYFQ